MRKINKTHTHTPEEKKVFSRSLFIIVILTPPPHLPKKNIYHHAQTNTHIHYSEEKKNSCMRLDRYQIEKNPILFYSANREKRIKEKKTKKK